MRGTVAKRLRRIVEGATVGMPWKPDAIRQYRNLKRTYTRRTVTMINPWGTGVSRTDRRAHVAQAQVVAARGKR